MRLADRTYYSSLLDKEVTEKDIYLEYKNALKEERITKEQYPDFKSFRESCIKTLGLDVVIYELKTNA